MTELKYVNSCAVCAHEKRMEIDERILSQKTTQKVLALEYGISEQSISNHKNKHVLDSSMNIERLELMVQRALAKDLQPDNIGELVRLLEYHDKLHKCEICPHKMNADRPQRSIENVLTEFLEDDSDEIYISKEENDLFIAWLKTLPATNELRKKYALYALKIKEDSNTLSPSENLMEPLYVARSKVKLDRNTIGI